METNKIEEMRKCVNTIRSHCPTSLGLKKYNPDECRGLSKCFKCWMDALEVTKDEVEDEENEDI